MTIYGQIISEIGGLPLQGSYQTKVNGLNASTVFNTDSNGRFTLIYTEVPNKMLVLNAPGYKETSFSLDGMIEYETYQFGLMPAAGTDTGNQPNTPTTNNKNILPAIALAGTALYIANEERKKNKKISGRRYYEERGLTTKSVTPYLVVGAGILGFSLVRKTLEALGIWKDKDEKGVDEAETDPKNAWNPNYWRNKPANIPFTYAITQSQAYAHAKQIYDSFGAFNDCEECAKGVIKKMKTKANVSFLAEMFFDKYGQDLLTFLRGGWYPQDRLSDSDVNELIEYVKKLPNY